MKKGSGRAQKDRDKPILPPPPKRIRAQRPQKPNPEGPPLLPRTAPKTLQVTTRCKNGSGMIMITTSYNDKTSSGARAYNNKMRKYTLGRDCLPAQDTSTRLQHTNRRHFEP